jgi:hypothetical protein
VSAAHPARCASAAPPPPKDGRSTSTPHEDEVRAARRHASARAFADSSPRWRPMVKRSIAWLVADGCRLLRYRGIDRNHIWLSVRMAAINLRRLLALGLVRRDGDWVLA